MVCVPKSGLSLVLDAEGKEGTECVQCGFSTRKLLMKSEFVKDEIFTLASFQI